MSTFVHKRLGRGGLVSLGSNGTFPRAEVDEVLLGSEGELRLYGEEHTTMAWPGDSEPDRHPAWTARLLPIWG